MARYAKRTETLAVQVWIKDSDYQRGEGHVSIEIVEILPDTAYSSRRPDDDGRSDPKGWARPLPLRGLEIYAHLRVADDEPWYYGHAFRDVYKIELEDAQNMAATLELIRKGLARLYDQAGNPCSFGAYVQRIATILGVRLCYRGQKAAQPIHDGIADHVDRQIRVWLEGKRAGAQPALQASNPNQDDQLKVAS